MSRFAWSAGDVVPVDEPEELAAQPPKAKFLWSVDDVVELTAYFRSLTPLERHVNFDSIDRDIDLAKNEFVRRVQPILDRMIRKMLDVAATAYDKNKMIDPDRITVPFKSELIDVVTRAMIEASDSGRRTIIEEFGSQTGQSVALHYGGGHSQKSHGHGSGSWDAPKMGPLDGESYDVLMRYQISSDDLNDALRADVLTPTQLNDMKTLEQTIYSAPKPTSDGLLYRGISAEHGLQLAEGQRVRPRGFVSTTTSPEVAERYARGSGYTVKISTPAGQPGLRVGDVMESFDDEILLPRATTFWVTGVDHAARTVQMTTKPPEGYDPWAGPPPLALSLDEKMLSAESPTLWDLKPTDLTKIWAAKAKSVAGIITSKLSGHFALGILRTSGEGLTTRDLTTQLLESVTSAIVTDAKRLSPTVVIDAFQTGRASQAQQLAATKAQYSAILDSNTCAPCRSLDMQTFVVGTAEYDRNMPPYSGCRGYDNCRCVYVYDFLDSDSVLIFHYGGGHNQATHGRGAARSYLEAEMEDYEKAALVDLINIKVDPST